MELEKTQILKVVVGSQAHGLETPESDYDYRGVFVVPTVEFFRLPLQKITNTSWLEGKDDDTSWEIGHFLSLATHCNPTILECLLAKQYPARITRDYTLGDELQDLFTDIWNSEDVYRAFSGYSKNQQKKFLDKKDSRPHKYASAYLRVLYQGTQLLETGTFPVNFRETPIYNTLVEWKNKRYNIGEVMNETTEWEKKFLAAYEKNPNKKTNFDCVNEFLLHVREKFWEVKK